MNKLNYLLLKNTHFGQYVLIKFPRQNLRLKYEYNFQDDLDMSRSKEVRLRSRSGQSDSRSGHPDSRSGHPDSRSSQADKMRIRGQADRNSSISEQSDKSSGRVSASRPPLPKK